MQVHSLTLAFTLAPYAKVHETDVLAALDHGTT